ncbi:MAG: mannose-6-phosphate isomerase, class I [Lachnospiraceae bacterium]|nr:mannose-6-phosphate isomerase, class I [Lachnospiraceae bacterium]
MNAPFLLKPAYQHYLWGGMRLPELFGKSADRLPLAESWECSTHPDGETTVASGLFDGMTLAEVLRANPAFLGQKFKGQTDLPVLVKLIDAEKDLSIQVHPTDEYAAEHENGQRGKTEMWYVLEAAEGAELIVGFRKECTKEVLRAHARDGTLEDVLCRVPVKKGEAYFIEAGTVHAICAGCLVAEIQQSSNLTYRLYDYNRRDAEGNLRPLHLDKALAVADCHTTDPARVRVFEDKGSAEASLPVAACKYFHVYLWNLSSPDAQDMRIPSTDSFAALLCIEGEGRLETEEAELPLKKGDCVFVPAENSAVTLTGKLKLLCIQG